MKTIVKTLALVLLIAVFCSSTYIAAVAAEDNVDYDAATYDESNAGNISRFANDSQMATFSEAAASSYDSGTRLGGNRVSNIENAPALRSDYEVVIPRVDLVETQPEQQNTTPYHEAPATGAISFMTQTMSGFAMLGGSALIAKKGKGKDQDGSCAA